MTGASVWSAGWPALLPLSGFACSLALGGFVASRRGTSSLKRSLAAVNIAVAVWNFDVFLLFTLRDGETVGRVDRLLQPPIIALPFLALLFLFVFLGRPLRQPLLVGFGAWGAALAAVSATPHFLAGWRRLWFGWYGRPGALYPLFVGYLVAYLAISTTLLVREARRSPDPLRRAQARWLLAASLVLGLASLTNFLPLFGVGLLPLGNVASVGYVAVMAVTIVRHQLLDVHQIFRAGMLYSLLTFLLTTLTLALVLGLQRWFQDAVFAGSLLLPMIPALAVGVAVGPLKSALQERLDRTFFRSAAERRARLEAFAALLRPLEREEELWSAAWEHGWRHARPSCRLILRHADGAWQTLCGEPVAPADADTAAGALAAPGRARRLASGGRFEVAVPVVGGDGLLGGCLLGAQSGGESWSVADLAFCDAIAGQTALAVERARLRERIGREERLAALGRMAAVVSHELRNPLNVIGSAVGVLRRQRGEQPAQPVLGVIAEQVGRGERFISDLLSACRESRLHRAPIDLAVVLREFAADWGGRARFALEGPEGGLWVAGDAFRLRQVLDNLARNAVEAGGADGRVEVSVERPADGGVAVAVADRGPGVDPCLLPEIFEPFRTTKVRGTGLGLSIVKGIVAAHGGRVAAANRPGGGAVFRVWLPALARDAAGATPKEGIDA